MILIDTASNTTGAWVATRRQGEWLIGVNMAAAGSVKFEWRETGAATSFPVTDENGQVVITASRSVVAKLPDGEVRAITTSLTGQCTCFLSYSGD